MDIGRLMNMFVNVFLRTVMRKISLRIIKGGMGAGKRAMRAKKKSGKMTGPEDKVIGQLDNFRGPNGR